MGKVRKSTYRKPPTPEGLQKIEEGTLKWFDPEMFANFNTAVLEEYLEEKNRKDSFKASIWNWKYVIISIIIGCFFALVNQYVGLKVGMVVSGSWYIVYLLGLAWKWSPTETNIGSTASNGAAMICTGFVFTYPAIYLLAISDKYQLAGGGHLINEANLPSLGVAIIATTLSGILGVLYFIIFRRIWLVEDPLPVPGFEATVKLMDITKDISSGAREQAKKSIRLVSLSTLGIMFLVFLRDFRLIPTGQFDKETGKPIYISILAKIMGDRFYDGNNGYFVQPYDTATYTHISFGIIPIQFAIGWFMKFRTALLMSLGTLFTWFVVVPMAVLINVPVFFPKYDANIAVGDAFVLGAALGDPTLTPAIVAFAKIGRILAIGAILGGGITGLLKMAPVFKSATQDVVKIKGVERRDYVKGRGWYEWPVTQIIPMGVITFIVISIVFAAAGLPLFQSLIFSLLLVGTTFFLGAIAVKVMGETGTEPVSATSFIVLLMLVVVFQLTGMPVEITLIMSLIGTTVFGGAISMSGDIILNFKNGLYIGNRPYHLVKAVTIGIIPGAIISAAAATFFSIGLANGTLKGLEAPQANAFATFAQILVGGNINWGIFFLGIGVGVFIELMTGMGTAFGLGMYFPLAITLPLLVGGGLSDLWEKHSLEPKVKKEKWTEKQKTLKTLETYMIATGFIVGEALMGTIIALYLFGTM
jgi:uncharacterized oligopeptide transporter (OPT) family protein